MSIESIRALRRANPRDRVRPESVDAVEDQVRAQITASAVEQVARRRRRSLRVPAVASLAAAAVAAAALTVGWPGGGSGVENATAAVRKAATVTAASAERSGTAVVRMTHDGEPWAGSTVRWHGDDLSVARDVPAGDKRPLLLVDGMLYGADVDGGWIELGNPDSIDPDSGTTPAEYRAATREDVGGATLKRITRAMRGPTTTQLADGSTVYRGAVAAGLIARETGFKEGQHLRVLPFGYVAHDAAHDPASLLDTAVTVGPEGIVREIAVRWGTWTYTVTYSDLGTGAPIVAPANAKPFPDRTPVEPPRRP
jgi:hypothetical protein